MLEDLCSEWTRCCEQRPKRRDDTRRAANGLTLTAIDDVAGALRILQPADPAAAPGSISELRGALSAGFARVFGA